MVMAKHIRERLIAVKKSAICGAGAAALGILTIVVLLLATGCGDRASDAGDWLAYVPADAGSVVIVDYRALHNGDVPEDYAEYFYGELGGSGYIYDFLGVDEDNLIIHASASDVDSGGTLTILRGSFDFDVIREELENDQGCGDGDYQGFELWECTSQRYPAVSLFEKDGYVVLADWQQSELEDVLTYKSRSPERLANADDSDINRLLNRADGWLKIAFLEYPCPNQCEGFVGVLEKSSDSVTMPMSFALLFNSEDAATAAKRNSEVEELLHEFFFWTLRLGLDISELKVEDEFVVGSGTAEFVAPSSR